QAPRAVPLQRYLEQALNRPVRFIVPESYAEVLTALRAGQVDAAMLGELASRQGQERGVVEPLVAPAGTDQRQPTYASVIITRIDSGIHDLSGLRGGIVGLVDEQSTSGYLVPRAMLREAGLDPETDFTTRLLGRHRFVVDGVIAGELSAGAVHESRLRPPSLEQGPEFARLRVLARSQPIPLGPLVVRRGLDQESRELLTRALLRVHDADPAAAAVLNLNGLRFTNARPRLAPTLRSIAALAGVSYGTVSRVVNQTGYVAPATAARVNAIVDEVGYVPNGNARLLQGQLAPLVGLLIPSPLTQATPAWLATADRLHERLAAAGVPLVLCPVPAPPGDRLFIPLLQDRRLAALITGPAHAADPGLTALARTGHPVIAIDVATVAPGMIHCSAAEAVAAVLTALGRPAPMAAEMS
ncbi:MAG: phosphate/phosphite/phosphonate ABC transporter substrate-binding protein, partial [Chloroflexota bacterium]|nr:phosphate/phosphite/phosphonate ABC transporter substrate-binding protein [Chloroflexota bacterium]